MWREEGRKRRRRSEGDHLTFSRRTPLSTMTVTCCPDRRIMKGYTSLTLLGVLLFSNISLIASFSFSPSVRRHQQRLNSRLPAETSSSVDYEKVKDNNNHNNDDSLQASVSKNVITEIPPENDTSSLSSTLAQQRSNKNKACFDLATALFCGGLAFDVYVEPPPDSSRWEKGSQGLKVAFVSLSYTRQLYKGLVEVTVLKCTGLPEDDSARERFLSGTGVDACLLVAAVEGSWKEDVELLEKEQYHEGVLDLTGAAHVGRSSVAWAHTTQKKSQLNKKRRGVALPYHIPATWGKGGQAIWPEPEPFYLYVQDPATARLVFTVFDADKVGIGKAIGSTYNRLASVIPQAGLTFQELVTDLKGELLEKVQRGDVDSLDENAIIQLGAKSWQGELKLTSKPRKRDKTSQIVAGATAGAYLGGPVGAAAGALIGNFYEGQVQGRIELRLRYLPIPQVPMARSAYRVLGGMPGIDWGALYEKFKGLRETLPSSSLLDIDDLEHCFYINHAKTGATCSVYRSLEKKLIVVAFRGTCEPIDLITDAKIAQDAWVEGEDVKEQSTAKVHAGFRSSLNSISRRLKELILATVAPGDKISDYDMLVTGHSLGAALATLFTADIGEYGIDAGRPLPQLLESEPWWKSVATTFMGQQAQVAEAKEPPRPKSLRLYSFGSPRVGNHAFADLFDALQGDGLIDQSYRIVNGDDVVARLPRTMNALVAQVGYEHCGPTVLISQPSNTSVPDPAPLLWIEGESDDNQCPVRDVVALTKPFAEGSLLADLYNTTRSSFGEESPLSWNKLTEAASRVSDRIKTLTAGDVASVLGIDRNFTEREVKMVQSIFQGQALAHHMEDEYYAGMGRASGLLARVGEEIVDLEFKKDKAG